MTDLRQRRGFASLAVVVLLAGAGLAVVASAPAPLAPYEATAQPSNCIFCEVCADPDIRSLGHQIYSDIAADKGQNSHSYCIEVPGCPHPDCGDAMLQPVSDSLGVMLEELVANPTADGAAAALAAFPEYVDVNLALGTIDAYAPCNKIGIIARIPVPVTPELARLDRSPGAPVEVALRE
jgi:hypothetical protein